MTRFIAILATGLMFAAHSIAAQTTLPEKNAALFDALGLPAMLEIMRSEGVSYGDTISRDMFPGGGGAQWDQMVSALYDIDLMEDRIRADLAKELEGDDIDAMIDFFTSDPGKTLIQLEVSARKAMLDDSVDEAARDRAAIAMTDQTHRYALVERFVEVNNLIETNVVGALNSNYAFYMGLMDGGAMPDGVTAEIALDDVRRQEPEIRMNTSEWVFAFLLMAYQPASDQDLEQYIAFSASDAGQDLNDAMFNAFNNMFDDISRGLGRATSRFVTSQEL